MPLPSILERIISAAHRLREAQPAQCLAEIIGRLDEGFAHTECFLRSSRSTNSNETTEVALRSTFGAQPWSKASFQRRTQRHHWSPGLRPGKENSGRGVLRSFPRFLLKVRNCSLMTAQTQCRPRSPAPVRQQPSRKKPVMGEVEQVASASPRTLRLDMGEL